MKSNCGTLGDSMTFDGEQEFRRSSYAQSLDHPAEKTYILNMASGKKIQVPSNQLVIFSTNLEPKDLVDDAFLRRNSYKIEGWRTAESDFSANSSNPMLPVRRSVERRASIILTHYLPINRPFGNCQPGFAAAGSQLLPLQRSGNRTQKRIPRLCCDNYFFSDVVQQRYRTSTEACR